MRTSATSCKKLGVEIFNVYNVQTSVLRALIESPSIMTILNSTEAGLYEVVVRNRRYTGQQLQALPFIDQMTVSRIRRGTQWLIPRGHDGDRTWRPLDLYQ